MLQICKLRVAAKGQGLQGFGRPGAAASIHACARVCVCVCVCACVSVCVCVFQKNQVVHGCAQGSMVVWLGLADELLL